MAGVPAGLAAGVRVSGHISLGLRLVKRAVRMEVLKTQARLHLPQARQDQAILALPLTRRPRLAVRPSGQGPPTSPSPVNRQRLPAPLSLPNERLESSRQKQPAHSCTSTIAR